MGGTKRYFLAALLAALCLALLSAPASAGEQWCEDDPLVVITTPGGAQVPIYVTSAALGLEHLPAVQQAIISYTAKSAGSSTLVQMNVTVPDDPVDSHFATRTTASTGPLATGTVLANVANASGFSGAAMNMQFMLNVS
jgi:hypothetical protein